MRVISTIDHIQIAAPPQCEGAGRRFFGKLLEMEEEEKPEKLKARGGCWFRAGDVRIHIGVEDPFHPQRKAHPCFGVSKIDELAERLQNARYSVLWDTQIPGVRRFYTEDPFGNRIEFMEV
jgi:catechol 2,3-dioxygenase-like lactoylglutathione lyase family enzyme